MQYCTRARQEHFNTDTRAAAGPRWACWQRAACRRPRERRAPSRPSQPPSTPPSSRRSCQPACRTPARKRSKCKPTARTERAFNKFGKNTPLLPISKFNSSVDSILRMQRSNQINITVREFREITYCIVDFYYSYRLPHLISLFTRTISTSAVRAI